MYNVSKVKKSLLTSFLVPVVVGEFMFRCSVQIYTVDPSDHVRSLPSLALD